MPGSRAATEPPASWLEAAQREIVRSEYHFTRQEDGAWSAPNRVHGLRVRIKDDDREIFSRTGGPSDWRITVGVEAYGRGNELQPIASGSIAVDGRRVEVDRGVLEEWYVNGESGLKQGFTIRVPPEKAGNSGALAIEISFGGTLQHRFDPDGHEVVFRRGASPILRYSGLHVEDSTGAPLPAWLEPASRGVRIRVDDSGAAYPILVDPLFAAPSWYVTGVEGDRLGWVVSTAGDVNGDGFSDLIIGVPKFDGGTSDEGAAFVYLGSATGPSTTADWRAESNAISSDFGKAVATAGDVNADGFDDVIIGAPNYTNGQNSEGKAFLWLGGASGLGPNGEPSNPDWAFECDAENAFLGTSVASAGDVNGDGRDDVLVGAPGYSAGQQEEGRVFFFLGTSVALTFTSAWTAESDQDCHTASPPTCVPVQFGKAVSSAGDVNGDGYADILIGAEQYTNGQPGEGAVFVWHGDSGFGSGPDGNPTNVAWYAEANVGGTDFGIAVGAAGDVDGDGFADIVVGAPGFSDPETQEGKVFVWHGGTSGLGVVGSPANADWTAESNLSAAAPMFGYAVGTAGDVNGDGYADVAVGAWNWPNSITSEGAAYVWHGGPSGLGPSGTPGNADWKVEGVQSFACYGSTVAAAGDVNGDGFGDLVVGAPQYNEPAETYNGAAFLYLGSAEGPALTPVWNFEGDQSRAALGLAVTAGDINGDGYTDVVVGAPYYDDIVTDEGKAFVFIGSSTGPSVSPMWSARSNHPQAEFGLSVDAAGDVNNDGYADLLIGSPAFEKGLADEGGVFLWLGGPAGSGDPTGLGADGTPSNADWSVRSGQAGARMGESLAWAGDVNGDGYWDLIIGAPLYDGYDTDDGRAWIHPGGAAGPGSPIWTQDGGGFQGHFGASVAAAGDVNGDGLGDWIVGMPGYSAQAANGGLAAAFLGSGGTLSTSAHWIAGGNIADARLGAAVSSAGDVNGDGFSDILVGAPGFTASFTGEGAVFAYYGSSSGLPALGVDWTAYGGLENAALGSSVAPAGDIDLDGFGDVLLGAPGWGTISDPEMGRAGLWYGSTAGLLPIAGGAVDAGWSIMGSQDDERLGFSLSGAGDVNGDGFPDLLIGAPKASLPDTDEGRAIVYLGGGEGGPFRPLQQYRADSTAPIHLLGRSDADDSFRLRILARTAQGRGRVRLQWEIKPLAMPLDGSDLGTSAAWVDTGAPIFTVGSAVQMDGAVLGFDPGTFLKWRVRVLGDSPWFPRSPWFSPQGNTRTETDLRTDGCVDWDSDGYGLVPDPLCTHGSILDCDDTEPTVFPGNPEVCDGLDNNCDGEIDEGNPGGGGYCDTGLPGVCADGTLMCNDGALECEQDTPHSDEELCDGLDNDCDGIVPDDELDNDSDGLASCEGDCNDADFGSMATPEIVTGVLIHSLGPGEGHRMTWDSQDLTAGSGTVYDIFSGYTAFLQPDGDFTTGQCLVENIGGAEEYDLIGSDPPSLRARYFMLRGQNHCPVAHGSYGDYNRDLGNRFSDLPCN